MTTLNQSLKRTNENLSFIGWSGVISRRWYCLYLCIALATPVILNFIVFYGIYQFNGRTLTSVEPIAIFTMNHIREITNSLHLGILVTVAFAIIYIFAHIVCALALLTLPLRRGRDIFQSWDAPLWFVFVYFLFFYFTGGFFGIGLLLLLVWPRHISVKPSSSLERKSV